MKILTSDQMKEADRKTINQLGLPGIVLMENAAQRVTEFILNLPEKPERVVVLAGPGNNGGDGLAVARQLAKAGLNLSLWSTAKPGTYKAEAAVNEQYHLNTGFKISRLLDSGSLQLFLSDLDNADLLVDALLGLGTVRKIEGLFDNLIHEINSRKLPVIAVDLPSGVNADTGEIMGAAIKAKWTVTFAFPKPGLLLYPGAALAGEVYVGEIYVPESLAEESRIDLTTLDFVRENLPLKPVDAHKGTMGKVMLVAGSPGMTGAALLSALAALKSGSGLVYIAAPESICPTLEAKTVEVITVALPEAAPGIIDPAAAKEIIAKAELCDVLAIGPGLNTGEETAELINKLVQLCPVPLVFDAGALEAISRQINVLRAAKHPPVITPHPGEMARLERTTVQHVQDNRIEIASKNARLWNCIILLKGANSIIAAPDGKITINPTGSPVLATAGSGDLLTGLVASLIAQGMIPENAVKAGAFIHGLAGDLISSLRGHSASDILECFQRTFQFINESGDKANLNPYLAKIRPVNNIYHK
ncbi:MAG: NAD(P)H-hydrate dehydratase [Bacillota bacterium]|nr:NAD(P)H-hydrate dehydratase [Bacillota bacterium]